MGTPSEDPNRTLAIAVLQAGSDHSREGNPGPELNWHLFSTLARQAAEVTPDLIAFPEYAISGWPYPSEEVINGLGETIPGNGPWYQRYVSLVKELGVPILGWLVDADGDRLYNASFLLDAQGAFVAKYRKVHANLGEQTWWGWSQGSSLQPIEYNGVRYGISICADMWFPETVRCEELSGAHLIIHQSIADDMGHIIPIRALDSEIPIVAAIFNGGSYAVDSQGHLLGKLPAQTAGWKVFSVSPFRVRTHAKYGGLWIPKLGHRNLRKVDAYGALVDPATRPTWTQVFLDRDGLPQTRAQLLDRLGGHYDADDPVLYHTERVYFPAPWTSPFTVDPLRPYQLINGEGHHLFIVNKTAWAFFDCQDPAAFLDRARDQGVNVIRVALEGTPYWAQLGIDMWPWGGTRAAPEWSRFNDEYWDEVERRIRLAGERGVGLDIVLYFTLHPQADQIPQQRPYWEHVLRRLGRYANVLTWEIANEYTANEAFQDAAGRYLNERDPYRRPVCTSDGTTDEAVWPDKDWMGLAINHTCTSSTPRHDLRDWYLAVAANTRAHGKPAFCNESGRERRHQNDDGIHRRKQGWLWCMSGGFWTWHAWDGCEGIDDATYHAPGEEFLRPMAEFFRSLAFWRLAPSHTTLTVSDPELISATLAEPGRATVASYVCTRHTGTGIAEAQSLVRLPEGLYQLAFYAPADLALLSTHVHRSKGLKEQAAIELPRVTDDLVILVERHLR